MKKVKLIGPGLKLDNSWYWCGEIVIINDDEYEKNKNFLEVLENIEEDPSNNNLTKVDNENTNTNNNIDKEKDDNTDTDNNANENETESNEDKSNDDEELEILKEKAKELGIPGFHLMKKETLLARISEIEKNNV